MRSDPLISICLPVFNGQTFLASCLESALSQDEGNFELLISDDCSSDNSFDIITSFARADSRIIHWKNERRLGLFANYNKCLSRACGKFIKTYAQDDLWKVDLLGKQVERLKQNQSLSL